MKVPLLDPFPTDTLIQAAAEATRVRVKQEETDANVTALRSLKRGADTVDGDDEEV